MIVTDCTHIRHRFPWQRWPKRVYGRIDTIVVHRNAIGRDADSVADWYEANPEWAGPRMPYHFVIKKDGTIEQALALEIRGNHARGRNTRSIGIGLIGDFRNEVPTPEQLQSLYRLLTALNRWIGGVRRHRKLGRWACPGKKLDVEHLASLAKSPSALNNEAATIAAMGVRL